MVMTKLAAEAVIAQDDPLRADVVDLLRHHHAFTQAHSPAGECYAFNAEELAAPEVTFWTARQDGVLAGCVALCARSTDFAELKSLHVRADARGSGLGEALVAHVIRAAHAGGYTHLGLETGPSDGFAPSRRLYERLGFVHGPAFPPYKDGTFSYCMTRAV